MKFVITWFGILTSLVCASQVVANTITFSAKMEFSGATPPAGPAPWLTATFDDGAAGSVTLTLAAANLTANEFVTEWDFNIDPALEASVGSLQFTGPTKVGSFTDPTIGKVANAFKADGDGEYDISFGFTSSDGANSRFGVGDSVGDSATYTITGISTLTASSFNFLSNPSGGHGPYYMAAHVQGIATGVGSGWVTTVPEPSSFVLAGVGLLGLAFAWRRRRN